MSYSPVRALTAGELATIRSDGQFTRMRAIIIPQQPIVYLQCSGSMANNDAVTSVAVTVVSGSVARVENGMTGYVGTAPGLSDVGMVRVKACTASTLTVGSVSGIYWSTALYITIVDDYGIWQKLPRDITFVQMDDNVTYTNQNQYTNPVPIMGPDLAVPYSSGSIPLNASNSYSPDGSAISTYAWSVSSGSTASGSIVASGSAVTSFVFPGPGSYILKLTVTTANGKSTTGHRNIYVYDEANYKPLDQIQLDTLVGSRDEGGWEAEITMWAGSGSAVRDRAKVILISDDYYSGSVANIGQYAGGEKVCMVGWISEETIKYDAEKSTVKFTIHGPHWWLKKCTGPSTFLECIEGTPDAWTSFNNLTFDKCVYHFLYWRSTAIEVIDVYACNNTRIIGGMSASIGNLYDQLNDTGESRMLQYLCADKFGRLFPYIDPQVLSLASRSSLVTVMSVTNDDVTEQVDLKRQITPPVSLLEVAGLAYNNGDELKMYMSRAPGKLTYGRFGDNDQNDRLVVSSQSDANNLSGMLLAKKNNVYAEEHLTLGQINKMLDIAPGMYFTLTASAVMNARQIGFTDKRFLPTRVEYSVDNEKGLVKVDVDCEGETSGSPGFTVIAPQEPIYDFPTEPSISAGYALTPGFNYGSDYSPKNPVSGSSGSSCRSLIFTAATGPFTAVVGKELASNSMTSLIIPFRAYLRPATASNKSAYTLSAEWLKLIAPGGYGPIASVSYEQDMDDDWYSIYALDLYGNRVASGVKDAVIDPQLRTGTFNNPAGVDIFAIEIAINNPQLFNVSSGSPRFISYTGETLCAGDVGFNGVTSNFIWYYQNNGVHFHGAGVLDNAAFGHVYSAAAYCESQIQFSDSVARLIRIKGFVNSSYDSRDCVRIGFFKWDVANPVPLYTVLGNKLPDQGLIYYYSPTNQLLYLGAHIFGGPRGTVVNMNLLAYFDIEYVPDKIINVKSITLWNICSNILDG